MTHQNTGIAAILEAEDGAIWVSTQKGLSKFYYNSDTKISFINYDISDGVQGYDFNDNAAFKGKDGLLYFAGMNGFNVFNPSKIKSK